MKFWNGLAGVGDPENRGPDKILLSPPSINKLQEASIALWLINSDITSPNLQEILLFAKTNKFEEAYEIVFKKLKEKKLDKVYEEIEKPIIPIIKEMEDFGI